MAANVKHFSINADDVPRARRFYEGAFDWKFKPWGPPDFFLITTGDTKDPGLEGALQQRRTIVEGKPIYGYECTISVTSIDETVAAVEKHGGKIVMPRFVIPAVGTLIFFQDTEGNIVGAMQYNENAQ
jgi:predicted enzyme related to lactoylglutathione lyase